jgi:hypothetical protein
VKKLALFVEGQTEQIFVAKLLIELGGRHRLRVEAIRMFGGGKVCPRMELYRLTSGPPRPEHIFYALIIDCGNDARVVSEINDRYESM